MPDCSGTNRRQATALHRQLLLPLMDNNRSVQFGTTLRANPGPGIFKTEVSQQSIKGILISAKFKQQIINRKHLLSVKFPPDPPPDVSRPKPLRESIFCPMDILFQECHPYIINEKDTEGVTAAAPPRPTEPNVCRYAVGCPVDQAFRHCCESAPTKKAGEGF